MLFEWNSPSFLNPDNLNKEKYDAVVVGSGPNGLAAAITLQLAGLSVLIVEGKEVIGGGLRSAEITLPGYLHDVCAAIHPMAASSPVFTRLSLEKFGLQFITPAIQAAHPFDDGSCAVLHQSIEETAASLGKDALTYKNFITPFVRNWPRISNDVFGPFHFPDHPVEMLRFGYTGLSSALNIAERFRGMQARGLWAGMAAHSMLPLSARGSAAVAMIMMITGHLNGWPVIRGGSAEMANALAECFTAAGGTIETNCYIRSLDQLPASRAVLLDVTPMQVLSIAGNRLSTLYKWQLKQFRYGPGVFKIDWALDGPIPFTALDCRSAGTIHLGNTLEEIADAEQTVAEGKHPSHPFVLLAQQSLFDTSRAPRGKHTGWAYCHVPNGSEVDMTEAIENQVARFAPGFKDLILQRKTTNAVQMQQYNSNYVGGDINGGLMDIRQLFTRPALRLSPYRTSATGIYICSSSTPPGGGVHGMCGFHAAQKVLKDIFRR